MFDDLMSKAKSLACFLDTSTTNELAGSVKYNQEERAEDRHAFPLLHDYIKLGTNSSQADTLQVKSPILVKSAKS